MQVQIGEKIKQLRNRDNRTQEMLANAIGVTSQAISRWETSGGYPDVEIIPAIANFFHVSIDELFGYDGEREEKIQDIIIKTDEMIHVMDNIDGAVEMLSNAADEFPSELRILMRLGNALVVSGFMKHGARSSRPSEHHDGENMVEYNRQNADFLAALAIYEKILPDITDTNDRIFVIRNMVRMYAFRGEYEKAEALALKQDSVEISRECLLTFVATGEKRKVYEGEAILALTWQIANQIISAVTHRYDLNNSYVGIEKVLAVITLYESILDDDNCGFGHYALSTLYILCAKCAANQGLFQEAEKYLDCASEHNEAYLKLREQGGEFRYTAPLVESVTVQMDALPPAQKWAEIVQNLPEDLKKLVEGDVSKK